MALAQDLPAVWNAPTTNMGTKQRLLRVLVEEVLLDLDEDANQTVVTIHWMGGRHSETRVARVRTRRSPSKRQPKPVDVMRKLGGRCNDPHVVAHHDLHAPGRRPARRLGRLDHRRGNSALRGPGFCFVSDICDRAPLIGGHHHGAQSQSRTFAQSRRFAKAVLTECIRSIPIRVILLMVRLAPSGIDSTAILALLRPYGQRGGPSHLPGSTARAQRRDPFLAQQRGGSPPAQAQNRTAARSASASTPRGALSLVSLILVKLPMLAAICYTGVMRIDSPARDERLSLLLATDCRLLAPSRRRSQCGQV